MPTRPHLPVPSRLAAPCPADLALHLALLEATPQRLAAFANGRSDEQLAQAPAPKAWSPVEVLAHLRGCDEVWTHTLYAMLIEDEPALPVLDPRRWARAAGYAQLPFALSLRAFTLRRAELLRVLTALPLERWQRSARLGNHIHTVYTQARRLARHEQTHCDQLETA
jgi:hypothetical protein